MFNSAQHLQPFFCLRNIIDFYALSMALFVNYSVLARTDAPFNVIYDFVFDRLRSVRQDLVVQRIDDQAAIVIYETVIRFHVYSAFRFLNLFRYF